MATNGPAMRPEVEEAPSSDRSSVPADGSRGLPERGERMLLGDFDYKEA